MQAYEQMLIELQEAYVGHVDDTFVAFAPAHVLEGRQPVYSLEENR